MIASPRIAYLLATAKKYAEGILLTITYVTCRHQALRL